MAAQLVIRLKSCLTKPKFALAGFQKVAMSCLKKKLLIMISHDKDIYAEVPIMLKCL